MAVNAVEQVRSDYDRIAAEYARRLYGELSGKPKDRELLLRFAAAIRDRRPVDEDPSTGTPDLEEVCDMGCGPGHVARFLADNGMKVGGLDLSPGMLSHARRLSPDIEFREGNLLGLPYPDNALSGVTAFYAIVNIPAESLPVAFGEMLRVLKPGGLLLLTFHIGGDVIRPEEMWGAKVEMEFYHFARPVIEQMLRESGFRIEDVVEREPYAPDVEYQSRRAYIFARKPIT